MIISFERKFVFVAIPKTAGHSLRAILRPLMGGEDWEQCALFEKRSFPVEKLAKINHGHLTCRQLIPHLPDDDWENLFSFAFVRNPYDRFISYSTFMNRKNDKMQRDPLSTMKRSLSDRFQLLRVWMRPQYEFITNKQGEIIIDHVARFENIQRECDDILKRLGGSKTELPTINSSERTSYKDYYDDELKEMVEERYAKDLKYFGYEY